MTDQITWPTEPPTEPPPSHARPVASEWTRAGEFFLELVLMVCTFGFGWVGWWIIAWADGQSPAKVVLHLHVVNDADGHVAGFGRMALREALGKGVAGAAAVIAVYYGRVWLIALVGAYVSVNAVLALSDRRGRTWWDRLAKTVVVEGDPPRPFSPPVAGDTSRP